MFRRRTPAATAATPSDAALAIWLSDVLRRKPELLQRGMRWGCTVHKGSISDIPLPAYRITIESLTTEEEESLPCNSD